MYNGNTICPFFQVQLKNEQQHLISSIESIQRINSDFRNQLKQERDNKLTLDAQIVALKQQNEELSDRVVNLELVRSNFEASEEEHTKKDFKNVTELLRDVTQAYLQQSHYLRRRKAFTSTVKIRTCYLKNKIQAMGCLEDIWKEYGEPKEAYGEPKDVGIMCNRLPTVNAVSVATNTEVAVELPTPTPAKCLVDVGVNTMAGHRVTRATQANEMPCKTSDRSTQCDTQTELQLSDEETSVDLHDIFQTTICPLPEILSEISELIVPMVSSACQTETDITQSRSRDTLTELCNVSRMIDYRTAKRQRSEDPDPVKDEISTNKNLDEFEQYWTMAGRSLMGALLQLRSSASLPMGLSGLQCFQDQFLQQQMVAKFLNGTGPVKKAVSIPSVYAESTKSGYERDVEQEHDLNFTTSGERNVGSDDSRSSRSSSVDFSNSNRRRKRRASQEECFSPTLAPVHENPIGESSRSPEIFDAVDESTSSSISPMHSPAQVDHVQTDDTMKSPKAPLVKRRPQNSTVGRIMRARANVYKIRPVGKRWKSLNNKAVVAGQLKRIQLVKQPKPRQDSESEVDDSKLEKIRDYYGVPPHLDPILDGDLLNSPMKELREDLELSDSEEDEQGINGPTITCSNKSMNGIRSSTEEERNIQMDIEIPEKLHATEVVTETPSDTISPELEIEFDSPASPSPIDQQSHPDHAPKVISTEREVPPSQPKRNGMHTLKLTHTTLNQFIQNHTPLKRFHLGTSTDTYSASELYKTYLKPEWTSEAVAAGVNEFTEFIRGDPKSREEVVARVILNQMEVCSDDVVFEPFVSLAPFMPKTHQRVVQLVERLGLGPQMILEIERRIFTVQPDSIKLQGLINWTYMYLGLQDLEMNKQRYATSSLRLFLVKVLYYMKQRACVVVYLTLKAFPKLLPKVERGEKFAVGERRDPLTDVLVCVLSNSSNSVEGSARSLKGDTNEKNNIARYRKDLIKLQQLHYGYTVNQPSAEEVLTMLMDRVKTVQRDMNVIHGVLLLSKHMQVKWTQTEVLAKVLLPRIEEIMAGTRKLPLLVEQELCFYFTMMSGLLRPFPRTFDVSAYRNVFRDVLVNKERFSHAGQESAVMGIIRLSVFSLTDTYNAIKGWYAHPELLSPMLRAMLETFVSRKDPEFWIHLSNEDQQ